MSKIKWVMLAKFAAPLLVERLCAPAFAQNSQHLSAQDMSECAGLAVSLTKRIERITLDYSPGSLTQVDRILHQFHRNKPTKEQLPTLVGSFGCYVGEVLIRNLNGSWEFPSAGQKDVLGEQAIVRLPKGVVANPMGKVRKFVQSGTGDSAVALYQAAEQHSRQ